MLNDGRSDQVADRVVGDIHKDFRVMGTHRVHNWFAYALLGLVFGMALIMIYISNKNVQFSASSAARQPNNSAIQALPTGRQVVGGAALSGTQNPIKVFRDVVAYAISQQSGGGFYTPVEILVKEGKTRVLPGPEDDSFIITSEKKWPFATLAEQNKLINHLTTITSGANKGNGFDAVIADFAGNITDANDGYLIGSKSPDLQRLAVNGQSLEEGGSTRKGPKICNCVVHVTVSGDDGGSKFYKGKPAVQCTTDAQCNGDGGICEKAAKDDAAEAYGAGKPPPPEPAGPEPTPPAGGDPDKGAAKGSKRPTLPSKPDPWPEGYTSEDFDKDIKRAKDEQKRYDNERAAWEKYQKEHKQWEIKDKKFKDAEEKYLEFLKRVSTSDKGSKCNNYNTK